MTKKVEFLNSIKPLSKEDLQAKLSDSKARLHKLKFSHRFSPLENPKLINQLRKDIARMETILQAK